LTGGIPEFTGGTLAVEDWSETWKRHFHAFRASRRLMVKPSWESCATRPGDIVLEIDPGMTFGTGYHGTTRACLEFRDALAEELGPVPMLDAGCGSGILSLAAGRLGYRPVYAFDHDPDAVRMTEHNVGVDAAVVPVLADLGEYVPPRPCRLVVVNILATILCRHADRIVSFVDRTGGGHLILSGILTEQYDDVKRRFEKAGATEAEARTRHEWRSGHFLLR
jgi:ribosomal protein L11 methyltransferase